MRKLIALQILATCAIYAQTISITGPTSARAGGAATLSLSAAGANAAGLQWTLGMPTASYKATSAASVVTGKTLYCTQDKLTCILIGMNQSNITAGQVASYSVTVPVDAQPGPATFQLLGLVAVDSTGAAVPITSGGAYTLLILARQDINGDGKVDAADVQLIITQALDSRTNPAACVNDLNGDGRCDLVDVFDVLLKVLS